MGAGQEIHGDRANPWGQDRKSMGTGQVIHGYRAGNTWGQVIHWDK